MIKKNNKLNKNNSELYTCPLCEREVTSLSDHHLIPKSRGGKETCTICHDCHNAIHAFFTNKELERNYNTVESLLNDEKYSKHLKWLQKQPPGNKTKRVKNKKRRGRSG